MLMHFRRYQVNQYWKQINLSFARQFSVASINDCKIKTSQIPSERSELIVLSTQTAWINTIAQAQSNTVPIYILSKYSQDHSPSACDLPNIKFGTEILHNLVDYHSQNDNCLNKNITILAKIFSLIREKLHCRLSLFIPKKKFA